MCGICGTYGVSDKDLLRKMCGTMTHRGPDDEGHYYSSDIMLGMRRLKVIDIETGNQPIFNEDKSIAVVYNGEIYNYQENREYLEAKGHKFYTHSDTETIVHLYEELGDKCVERLRGMFAFALWDSKSKRLILARDRIGIKPLYYYFKDGALIFASELKAILQCSQVKKEINFHALHDYLTYMYVPAPDTIFNDIYKLLPGHILLYENDRIALKQYWDMNNGGYSHKELLIYGENELSAQLLKLMEESVKIHLISDVPLGVFLSGGTDSGSIVALASEISNKPVKTFSVGFEDDYYNELDNARLTANQYKTEHHEFVVKPQTIDYIEDILGFFDEPFADSSTIPTYYVSKCAKEHVTVALSGDGGDEIFCGYGNYKADKIGQYIRMLPDALKSKVVPFLINWLPQSHDSFSTSKQIKKLLTMSRLAPEYGHIFWLSVFNNDIKKKLYKNEYLKTISAVDSLERYYGYFEKYNGNDFINKCINVDIKTVLPDDYLTKVDRMSMANSLEVRVPFLDHKLLEFATAIPSRYKLKGLTTKHLLKKIMKKRLPEEIIGGRKKGFSVPLGKWFREGFSILIDKYLSKEIIEKRGYFNYDFVKSLSYDHIACRKDNSKLLWTLICFEIWHRKFMD